MNRRDAIATSLIMVGRGAPAGGFEPAATGSHRRRISFPEKPGVSEPIASPTTSSPDAEEAVVDIAASLAPDVVPDDTPTAIVGIESLAPDEFDVVPIESLAPDPERAGRLSPHRDAGDSRQRLPATPSRLELAFARRRTLRPEHDAPAPTLSGLIGAEIVPIASLLYRGSSCAGARRRGAHRDLHHPCRSIGFARTPPAAHPRTARPGTAGA